MNKAYIVINNKGQYLLKYGEDLIGVTYSYEKAKWLLEDHLGRLLGRDFKIEKEYRK